MSLKSYILHCRPRSWPIVALHSSVGGFLALDGLGAATGHAGRLVSGILLWAVCLNGGTLALNSAFDKDEGAIGYLDNPPPLPKMLGAFGFALMALGQVAAWYLGTLYAATYAACFFLSLVYSCPPLRLKSRAGFDVAINGVGYGALTTFAGWASLQSRAEHRIVLLCLGYGALFAGFYPLTQIYQYEEDVRHGDKGLTVRIGPRRALRFALIFIGLAFGIFFATLFVLPFETRTAARWLLLLVAFGWWLAILMAWLMREETYDTQKGFYRSLTAWGVTDLVVVLSFSRLVL